MRIAKTPIVVPKSGEERKTEKKHKTHQKDSGKFESLISVMKNGTNLHDIHKKSGSSKQPSAKVHKSKNLVKGSHTTHLNSDKAKKNSNSIGENSRVAEIPLDLSHKTNFSEHSKESENHPKLSNSEHVFDPQNAPSKSIKESKRTHRNISKVKDSSHKIISSKHSKGSENHSKLSNSEHVFDPQNAPSNLKEEFNRTHRNISKVKDSSHGIISLKHPKESKDHLRLSRLKQNSFNVHVSSDQNRNPSTHFKNEKSSKNIGIREREKKLEINRVPFRKKVKSSSVKNDKRKIVNLKKTFKYEKEKLNLSHFQKKVAFSIPENGQINKNDMQGVQMKKNVVFVNGDKITSTSTSKMTSKSKLTRIIGDDVHIKIEKGNFSKKNETSFSKIIDKVHVDLKRSEFKPYKVLPQVSREFAGHSQAKVSLKDGKIEGHEISNHIAHEISQAIIKALENQKPPLKLEIKLNPPQLGKVSITMVEKAGKTFLEINANNPRTQELLKMVTPVIVNQLSNLNFNVVEVQLNAQQWFENGSGANHGQGNGRDREKQKDDRNFSDDFKETYEKEV